MSRISAAVVGGGFIGPVHVEALRRAGVEVHGVLGSTAEKSRSLAASLRVPTAYRSFAEVLADPAVTAVHLATPNKLHFEQASAALHAGKHVMCEKPLAMNSQQTAELVRIAEGSGLAAGVNYNVRYYPLCVEAAARVRDGSVGEVLHVGGSYAQDWLLWETDWNWRVSAAEGGDLRAVADIGTHWLDLVQHITGRHVVSVCADLKTVHPIRKRPVGGAMTFSNSAPAEAEPVRVGTDDYGALLLQFEGNARGCVWVSQVTAGRKNRLAFEIAGSKRSLAFNGERPDELWIGRRDGPSELLVKDPSLMSASARRFADYPGGHAEGFPDTFKMLYRDFYGYIAAGDMTARPGFPTFADGHREVQLCEAVLLSARGRHWVDVAAAIL